MRASNMLTNKPAGQRRCKATYKWRKQMYRKVCHICNRPSFGSDSQGEWICPVCGADLSGEKSLPAEDRERSEEPSLRKRGILIHNKWGYKLSTK